MIFYGISVLNPDGNSARSHFKVVLFQKINFRLYGLGILKKDMKDINLSSRQAPDQICSFEPSDTQITL